MLQDFLKDFKKKTDKSIERFIKREITPKDSLFNKNIVSDYSAINNTIKKPIYDLLDRGGKRWRPALMYLSYKATGGNNDKLCYDFLCFIEIIHNASLIH